MIQRIQTVYLLLVVILGTLLCFFSPVQFLPADATEYVWLATFAKWPLACVARHFCQVAVGCHLCGYSAHRFGRYLSLQTPPATSANQCGECRAVRGLLCPPRTLYFLCS